MIQIQKSNPNLNVDRNDNSKSLAWKTFITAKDIQDAFNKLITELNSDSPIYNRKTDWLRYIDHDGTVINL